MAALGESADLADGRQAGADEDSAGNDRDGDNQGQSASRQLGCGRQANGQSAAQEITGFRITFASEAFAGIAARRCR